MIRYLSEIPAVIILVAEIVVIATGVFTRYVLHAPLIFTDELASLLFVWLSMLGAVVALQRGEHMRLATVVTWTPPRWQARLNTLCLVLALAAVLAILPAAFDHVVSQQIVTMATLDISESFRSAGIATGCTLLAAALALRIAREARLVDIIVGALLAAAVLGALWLAKPLLIAMGNFNLLVFFLVLLAVLITIALPIAFTFILCTVAYLLITTRTPLIVVVSRMEEGMPSMVLIAIPLGVLAAYRHGSWLDRIVMGFSVLGFSVPVFVIGYLLIYIFAIELNWLPVQGYQRLGQGIGGWLQRLILPSVTLSVIYVALIARITRTSVLEVMNEDYIRTARAKGQTEGRVLVRHE